MGRTLGNRCTLILFCKFPNSINSVQTINQNSNFKEFMEWAEHWEIDVHLSNSVNF